MAANSKPRKPVKRGPVQQHRNRTSSIKYAVNQALGKFYIVGDQAHMPVSFGFSEINMRLKGADVIIGRGLFNSFLFEEHNDWVITVYHFFNHDGVINVVPVSATIEKTTCPMAGDFIIAIANESKQVLLSSEEYIDLHDDYMGYGYYMTWFNDLGVNLDSLEKKRT